MGAMMATTTAAAGSAATTPKVDRNSIESSTLDTGATDHITGDKIHEELRGGEGPVENHDRR